MNEEIGRITLDDIQLLIKEAEKCEKKRARLCTHRSSEDRVHEMFIALHKNGYIRPHKHINKSESVYVIEGQADIVFFDKDGNINKVIPVGDYLSAVNCYYRINEPIYHAQFLRTGFFVFHEVTNGPFKREDTIFAPWAPEENNLARREKYINELEERIKIFRRK